MLLESILSREPGKRPVEAYEWREVTRQHPCPICGKTSWCATGGPLVACRRVDTGAGLHRIDKSQADYWLYRMDGQLAERSTIELPLRTEVECAGPDVLDRVYRAMIGDLRLSQVHREALRTRGLADEAISQAEYRTLPERGRAGLAQCLVERFGADVCARIPGIYLRQESDRQWWTVAGAVGLLVPVRNLSGQIVSLKIRSDEPGPDGSRYTSMSSRRHGGPGPGAQVHVPLHTGAEIPVVRLTEGELKADVSTALSSMLTISVPGVSSWRNALPVLGQLGTRTVHLAFDADAVANQHVARALSLTASALHNQGFEVVVETWDLQHAKGIDDLLARGLTPTKHIGTEAVTVVSQIATAAGVTPPPEQDHSSRSPAIHERPAEADSMAVVNQMFERVRTDESAPLYSDVIRALATIRQSENGVAVLDTIIRRLKTEFGWHGMTKLIKSVDAYIKESKKKARTNLISITGGKRGSDQPRLTAALQGVVLATKESPSDRPWLMARTTWDILADEGKFILSDAFRPAAYYHRERDHRLFELTSTAFLHHVTYQGRQAIKKTQEMIETMQAIASEEITERTRVRVGSAAIGTAEAPEHVALDMYNGRVLVVPPVDQGAPYVVPNNGEASVLFAEYNEGQSWEEPEQYPPLAEALATLGGYLTGECLGSRIVIENGAYSDQETEILLITYALQAFLRHFCRTRMIALAWGEGGNGKSTLIRRLLYLVSNNTSSQVTSVEEDRLDGIYAQVDKQPIIALDNLDSDLGNTFADMLATLATGAFIKRRSLFTNNEEVAIIPDTNIMISARTPKFKRDDVAQRLLPIPLAKLPGFVSETAMERNILASMNRVRASLITVIQNVLSVLPAARQDVRFRMTDFAMLLDAVLFLYPDPPGIPESILAKVTLQQHRFLAEENSLVEMLVAWMSENKRTAWKGKARELFAELKQYAYDNHLVLLVNGEGKLSKELRRVADAALTTYKTRIEFLNDGQRSIRIRCEGE